MKRGMNKFFSILLVLCMLLSMIPMAAFAATPSVLYLKPNSNWVSDGARFAAYFFGNGETWVSMTDSDGDGIYECSVPSGYTSVIFCRMNGSNSTNSWDNKWNQTADLGIPSDGTNCYNIAAGSWDNGGGTWSTVSGGSTEPVQVDYYLFGYINGANYGCEEDAANMGSYKFSSGKLTATFDQESYVGVKTTDNANWYMTEGFQGTSKSVTLYNTNSGLTSADKLYVPAGITVTFTLTVNSNDTLTLKYSTTASSCKHLFYTDGKCNACGSSCSHSWSGNTCTKCGTVCTHTWSNGFCSVCGIVCDHSYSGNKCTVCGQAKPSCTHSYTSKVTTAATCTTAGVTTYTCSKCGDSYTQSIAATGHSYTSKVTAATCTDQGYTTYTCSKCSDSYKTNYTDAKGHSFTGGTCTVCGAADSSYTLNYYLVGYINGANYGCEEDYTNMGSYKFSSGKLTATFTADSYVFVKTEGNGKWYLAEQYCEDTTCKFVVGGSEKMYVPGGVQVTFTLTENSDGSITLKYTKSTSSCSHLTHTTAGKCTVCGATVSHTWSSGVCSGCGLSCSHSSHNQSGICSTCGVAVSHSYSGNTCTVCGKTTSSSSSVKIHFVDAVVWQNVTAHIWKQKGTTTTTLNSWPGEIVNKDADGYFTIELDYQPVSGESLGFIFTNFNGGQTADVIIDYATLSSGEVWVKPNNWTNGDGKYDCYVTTVESSMVLSPEINGTAVTFRYENSSASKVYVAGSFNGWSTTANKLTKGSDGIWTTTVSMSEGVYEYKFIVDGQWILDPKNGLIGGYDNNSLVITGNAGSATASNVTVKLHFYRESGDYANWDAWMWSSTNEGQGCTFTDDATYKGKTATFTIPGGTNAWVNYKIRKTDWSDEEFYTRSIDISNIQSGTVHFFLNSGSATGSIVYGNDVIKMGKPTYANLDYNSGNIWVKTPLPVSGDFTKAFSVVKSDGSASGITVTGVTMDNNGYSLILSRKPALIEVHDLVVKCGTTVGIETDGLFYSSGFANDYTYYGNDLGATWSKSSTTFKVWAPTATGVSVMLYGSGNYGADDWISTTEMKLGEKGVYSVTISGDLDGVYYNYLVNFPGYSTEATDPYAKTTGVNGDRGMIINMDAYDPEGWDKDLSPNQGMNYTDAIIYEMHIREMTIDSTSGVKEEWRGKYLGLTQEGTNYEGRATALDHIKELGVTHVQLMPTYDHAGVDEYHLTDWQQYAWGYNPKNFNVPEGSFATDPYNGEVRVTEMKQMVQAFHSKGINVVMDVVYNHTYDGGNFCYNKIVPNYFSRFWGENNWSNGSGVGNDFATERSMGRNYIVDSIFYWVEEYHIDGFRFDLAGLIDIQTINEVISTVQARYPYVIFYGEGWAVGGTAIQDGHWTATKENAWQTGSMAFYNDTFRNDIAGDNGNSWGFATGDSGKADKMGDYFRASNGWSSSPSQTINYVSCHDNYTLIDKIIISRNGAYWDQMVKMNNMSAALYMLAQGIPYIYSGEELLREKKDEWGNRYHNTYDSSDYITKIRWNDLVDKEYAQVTDDYYAGLINFRKNHAALRCTNGSDAWGYTQYYKINDHCIMFYVSGYPNYECSDGIVIIYNANEGTQWVNIYDYGVPYGNWQACIHGMTAGVNPLWSTYDGSVGVEGLSTTVLVLGDLVHEESVYNNQSYSCSHGYHNQSGLCWDCGAKVDHYFVNGYCNHCNLAQSASGNMTVYFDNSTSQWGNVYAYAWTETGGRTTTYTEAWPGDQMTSVGNNIFAVTIPCAANNIIFTDNYGNQTVTQGLIKNDNGVLTSNLYYSSSASWGNYTSACAHSSHNTSGICSNCGVNVGHNWNNGYCSGCKTSCSHSNHNVSGYCTNCSSTVSHSWSGGKCTVCNKTCTHSWSGGKCSNCGMTCAHSYHDQNGSCYTCGSSVSHSYYGGLCSACGVYKQGYIESQSYYLAGYINGANYGCEDDYQNLGSYKFTNGQLTATFSSDSYVYVKTGDNASHYMTNGYVSGVTSATLHDSRTVSGDKLYVPGGKEVTFTLTVNSSNNTMVLGYTVEDPVCSHSYTSKVTTAATCTTTGVKTFTCSKCGDSYTQSIAAIGHNYTAKVTTAATCTAQGVETYTCANCGDSYTQAIAMIAHSYANGSCTACGKLDPSYAVTDTGFVLVTDLSQMTAGKYVLVANNNGTYQAMDTTLSSGKFAPVTVTVDGRIVTGDNLPVWNLETVDGGIALSLDGQYLSYSSSTSFKMDTAAYTWTVTVGDSGFILNASATSRGIYYSVSAAKFGAYSTTYQNSSSYISNLQLYKYQVGAQGCSHSYSSKVTTEATCTTDGVRTYTCSLCGASYTETIAAPGHSMENGSCTVCGYSQNYYLFGYINGADYGIGEDIDNIGIYQFVNGKLTVTFTEESYVAVKTGDNANFYMTNGWVGAVTSATLYKFTDPNATSANKLQIPGGQTVTFTLTENWDGNLTISYVVESSSCVHVEHNTDGICTTCGATVEHTFSNGVCTVCYKAQEGYDPYDYYLYGYINGANYGCEEDAANLGEYKFADGKLTVTFAADSYIGVKEVYPYGKFGAEVMAWYVTDGWLGTEITAATLYKSTEVAVGDKLYVPGGVELTFSLTKNADGTVGLSYTKNTACAHSYTYKVTTAATCTTSGVKTYTCSNCGDSYTEVIAATGHNYVSGTCTNCGKADPNCTHSYTAKVTTAATCTTAGLRTYTCSKCGDVYTEVIAATGHSYKSSITTAAGCTTDGVLTYTCANCSTSYRESIPATGHNYVGGTCSNCGGAEPTVDYYLFGYINGANYACEEDYENQGIYKFENGKLTATFDCDSYVAVKTGDNAKWFMTSGWQGETSTVVLYDTTTLNDVNKLYVPGNVEVTFTLTENSDGSLTLSYTTAEAECTHTYNSTLIKAATCTSYATYSLTCSACGEYHTVTADLLGQQWLRSIPGGMSSSDFTSQTMYRYRDYTSGGWVSLGTSTISYVNSWPSGFDTSNSLYSQYNNIGKKVSAYESATTKLTVDSDEIVGYLYYHWCYDGYPYTVANKTGSYNRFHAYFSTKSPDEANKHDASDDSYRFDDSTACDDSVWYFYVPVYGQTYSTYANGSGWGAWSDWSSSKVTASSTREVETAKMYRYTAAALADHSYSGGTCTVCGDGCSHSYTSKITTAATCVSGGIKTFTCSLCSYSYTEAIAATGHSFANGSCTVCGAADPGIAAGTYYLVGYINGADYGCEGDWENTGVYKFVDGKLTATFTQDSYIFVKTEDNSKWLLAESYCEDTTCTFKEGGSEKMFVPGGVEVAFTLTENADGSVTVSYTTGGTAECDHSYNVQITTPATCTTNGVKTYTCSKCGDVYTVTFAANGHSYTSKVTTTATCTTNGIKTYTCSACDHSYTEVIAAAGHKYSDGKCSVCGTVDPNCSHSYTSKVTSAPTCTGTGLRTYTCTKCGDVYNETIAATGHSFVDTVVPPTCELNGYTTHKCSVCGVSNPNTDPVNPIGHDYSKYVVTAPTCTEQGYTTYTCANCGNVKVWDYTNATGHNYVSGTCTACGNTSSTAYYLVGYINGADYGCESDWENLGSYKFVNGKLTATFTQDSYIFVKTGDNNKWLLSESYCTDSTCTFKEGGSEKMFVPGGVEITFTLTENADGSVTVSYTQGGTTGCDHSYTSKITTAATCTSAGVKTYTCSKCSASYTEMIAATGHSFANGSCTACGMADPSVVGTAYYLVGYINGADYGCEADYENMGTYKFVNGKLTATFTQDSYIFVKTEGNGKWLLADSYCTNTTCTFKEGGSEKMFVPGGKSLTFTLTENADGSVTVSYTTGSSAASVVPTLTLKAPTLEFKDMITVNAFYTAENTQDVVEMGMITYSTKVTSWSVATAENVIPGATYDADTGRYVSASQGIHAKYLGDTVYLAVYAKLSDGTYAYSKLAGYSPVQYATSKLSGSDTALKQLVVAMLNYGAAAQTHFGHNTGSLANASLTAEQKALPAAYNSSMVSSVPSASATKQGIFANNSGFAKKYPSISFEGAFCINYFFTPNYAPASGITLYYWNEADYNANSVLSTSNATGKFKLDGSGTGEYSGSITGIAAKALSEAVYVACAYKDSSGTVWTSGVLGYSIGAYCASQSTKGGTIADLAMATAVYGYHAKQYFG